MSIDIRKTHTMSRSQARQVADRLAGELAEKFDVDCRWDGDTLTFRRSGVDGTIGVGDDEIRVRARLGMLLAYLKPAVENEIRRYLDAHFT